MSVEEVGEVRYSALNVIDWTIPSFTLLSQKNDIRIWSPSFVHRGVDGNCRIILAWVPEGFTELNFRCQDGEESAVKCVRIGLANINNSVIFSSDGEWERGFLCAGYFKVRKFVSEEHLKSKWNSLKGNPRFRLFCEVVNRQCCQVVNASTHTNVEYGKFVHLYFVNHVQYVHACTIKFYNVVFFY